MKSFFFRFLRTLLIIAAIINLLCIFVFDGQIPSQIHLPFSFPAFPGGAAETAEAPVEEIAEEEVQEEHAAETAELPEEELEEEPAGEEPVEQPVEKPAEEPVSRCTITSPGGSNIRSGPGSDYEVITAYAYDTLLVVIGEPENGWYPIQAEDWTTGYIFESQISMLEENQNQDQNPEQTVEQPTY